MSNKDTIKSLNVREQCRLKLPIWYGSRDNYLHGFREVLANASDEITNNYDDGFIDVILSDDRKRMYVFDSGRGIPITGETDGVKNYELLFLRLFSGTNYDNLDNGKVTTGTNGSGVTILNYTSSYFEVNSCKDYKKSTLIFKDGGELVVERFNQPSDIKNGTSIAFELDSEVYTNTVYDVEEVKTILKSLAGSNCKLTIHFTYQDIKEKYHYDTLEDYLVENSTNIITNAHTFNVKNYNDESELNMVTCSWNVSTEPFQATYLNYTYLKDNGTIYDGFVDGMKKVFTKASKSKFTNMDIEMSFGMVVSVLSTNVEYANQTKFSSSKQLYKKIVSDYIVSNMEIYKAENPQEFDKILKHLQQINSFNMKNENSIKNIKKKLNENSGVGALNKIPNLIECKEKDVNKRILCICEGKSSLGAILNSKNDQQAIFPLRGKVLNCLKASDEKIFQNDVIIGLLMALGADAEQTKSGKIKIKFPPDKLRYSKIYIMVDFDFDGIGSILPLLLTAFYKLTPQLIEENRIYLCETPKYEVVIKNTEEELYAFYDEQLDEIKSKLNNGTYDIHYIKGLSELSEEAMSVCLSGQNDNAKLLRMGDVERTISELELWMGEKIDPRKEYIMKYFGEESAIE